ncbi:MAG: DUF4115 domain-containing protein [Candidatus Omnitrophota bacterium]|nr:DUF4115 domain-containing protein [Candidatus Omnitrophota bacterium]MDZ4242942.1 DUF4115 domain-containing protein [Candidatus Omnitrophota bacterium]
MTDVPKRKESILKETRVARDIPLMTVHEATKIPLDALKAIEEGYTVRSMSPFYRKQFLKMYAQYLGIDPLTVIDDYQTEKLPKVLKDKHPDEEFHLKMGTLLTKHRQQQLVIGLGIAVALLFAGKVFGWWGGKPAPKENKAAATAVKSPAKREQPRKAAAVPAVAVPKKAVLRKPGAPAQEKKAEVKAAPEPAGKAEPQSGPKTETVLLSVKDGQSREEPPAESDPDVASPAAKKPAFKGVNLTVRAKKRSWLQVKTDGSVVFRSTLEKGIVETWQAKESIELSGNNINYLEFEVNGELRSLGKTGSRTRKVVITKDGLSVKK